MMDVNEIMNNYVNIIGTMLSHGYTRKDINSVIDNFYSEKEKESKMKAELRAKAISAYKDYANYLSRNLIINSEGKKNLENSIENAFAEMEKGLENLEKANIMLKKEKNIDSFEKWLRDNHLL